MPTTRPSDGYQLVRGVRTASAFRSYEALYTAGSQGVLVDIFMGTRPLPAALAAFERDVATVSALRHPHILRLLELTTLGDGTPIVVSELPPGQTLRAWLDAGNAAPASVALEVVLALAGALAAAHARGVQHGAVVGENVFLVGAGSGTPGFPKLKGFGLEGLRDIPGTLSNGDGDDADGDHRPAERGATFGAAGDIAALAVLAECLLTSMQPPANEIDRRFLLGDEVIALLKRASGQAPGVAFESVTQFAVELKAAVVGEPGPLDDVGGAASTGARRASRGLGIALGLTSFVATFAVAFILGKPGAPLRKWISLRSSVAEAAFRWRSADETEARALPWSGEARGPAEPPPSPLVNGAHDDAQVVSPRQGITRHRPAARRPHPCPRRRAGQRPVRSRPMA
jgi:hypothetical protein